MVDPTVPNGPSHLPLLGALASFGAKAVGVASHAVAAAPTASPRLAAPRLQAA
ncbi:MAG TPA: hypothetical protein VG166_01665 [Caulobacteraceae bacterium]|nr:hypothetical protein [Caulobacteraceae bacterium]